jgi:hypothetical protein
MSLKVMPKKVTRIVPINAVNLKKCLSILDKLCELLKSKEKYLPNKTWSSI